MKKTFTKFLAALMLLAIFTPSMIAEGQTTVASFSRSGSDNTTTGGTFSTTFSAKSGYYQDNTGDCYMQILNTSAYWTTTPTSISFAAKIGGGSGNTDLTNAVYVSLLDANGDVITSTKTSVTSHITTNTGDDYTISIPVTNNVYGVKLSHEKQTSYNVRYFSFSLSYVAGGVTPTTYTVTFNAGDGEFVGNTDFTNASNSVAAGTYTLPSATPATGYTFDGWTATGITTPITGIYTVSGNVDFTAHYTQNGGGSTQTLTFDVSSNPGNWPTANDTELTDYTYTLNSVDYTFALKNVKCNSGYLMVTYVGVVGLPAIEGYKLTTVVASNSGGCSTSTKVGISSSASSASYIAGGQIQTWSTQSSSYTYTLTSTDANTMYYMYVTNKNAQITSLELTYEAVSADIPSITASNVDITYNATSGSIAYTIDNVPTPAGTLTASTTASWLTLGTVTSSAVPFTCTANDNVVSRSATVTLTYTYDGNNTVTKDVNVTQGVDPTLGTSTNPYTVAQARTFIDGLGGSTSTEKYVSGIVSQVDGYNSQYSSITYWISDDGTITNQLQVYSGKGIDGAGFSSVNDVEVTAEVVVKGNLKKHNSTYEFDYNNELVVYNGPQHNVEAPTFSPVAGTYTTAQTVTLSCATETATIFYTIDGTDPATSSTTQQYANPITVSSTTTIKAVAVMGQYTSNMATATYHFCSAEDPYTVTEALAFNEYPANNIYVRGIVSTAPTSLSSGTLTYYISADGTTTNELEVYKGKDLENANFTAVDDIQVGDIVTVFGNVVIYGTTNPIKEFARGNYLVSFERPAQQYTLTVTPSANVEIYTFVGDDPTQEGQAGAYTTQVYDGTTVGISVSAEEGYILTLIVDGTDVTSQLDETGWYEFTMPAHNVTVTATASLAPVVTTNTYTLATSITSGKQYIIVGKADSKYYAMGYDKGSNRHAIEIASDGATATATIANSQTNAHEFIISSLGGGYYSIMDATTSGGYLYAASSSGNQLKTETTLDENHNGDWNITINAETGVASVVADQSTNRNVMQFNTNGLFNCYASASQHPVYLYEKVYTIDIAGYGTSNGGYYLIASPVSNAFQPSATLGFVDATPENYDLYYFDEAQDKEWINFKKASGNYNPNFNIVSGKGYLYASKNGTTLHFQGTPYSGNGEVSLTYTTTSTHAATRGWNLIGNPFDDAAALNLPYYRLNGEGSALSANAETGNVAAMEGVFVYAYNEATSQAIAKAKFTKGGSKRSISLVNINVVNTRGNVADNAIVRFDEGSTMPKFTLRDDDTKIYFPMGDKDYAIVSSNGEGSMPVNFKAKEMGMYTISVETEGIDLSYIHLIDRLTGEDIDLLLDSKYSFIASNSDMESRFILSFGENGISANNNETFAFQNGNEIIVNGEGELQIFDVMGRMVKNTTINGVEAITMPQGVYVCKLNGNVQKIVVR